jgi:hypothetical protein
VKIYQIKITGPQLKAPLIYAYSTAKEAKRAVEFAKRYCGHDAVYLGKPKPKPKKVTP